MRIILNIDPSLNPIAQRIVLNIDLTNRHVFDAEKFANDTVKVLGYKPEQVKIEFDL